MERQRTQLRLQLKTTSVKHTESKGAPPRHSLRSHAAKLFQHQSSEDEMSEQSLTKAVSASQPLRAVAAEEEGGVRARQTVHLKTSQTNFSHQQLADSASAHLLFCLNAARPPAEVPQEITPPPSSCVLKYPARWAGGSAPEELAVSPQPSQRWAHGASTGRQNDGRHPGQKHLLMKSLPSEGTRRSWQDFYGFC